MKSGSWPKRSGVQLVFQFILTVFSAIVGRVLWRPLKLFQTKLSKSCIFSPCYMYWGMPCYASVLGSSYVLLPLCFQYFEGRFTYRCNEQVFVFF